MKTIIEENEDLDSALCDEIIRDYSHGIKDIFIPAGGTPSNFYAQMKLRSEPIWDDLKFFQVDDILNGPKKNIFTEFFETHLGKRYNQLVNINDGDQPTGAFTSFLGLGVNGHVAFHEPHLPIHFTKGCVELGAKTLNYLGLDQGTWGITYGLGTFLKSETIYLMVKGAHKLDILERFLDDDQSVPAVALKKHHNLKLLVDKETWSLVKSRSSDLLVS